MNEIEKLIFYLRKNPDWKEELNDMVLEWSGVLVFVKNVLYLDHLQSC